MQKRVWQHVDNMQAWAADERHISAMTNWTSARISSDDSHTEGFETANPKRFAMENEFIRHAC